MTGLHISHNLLQDHCLPLAVALYLGVLGSEISVDFWGGFVGMVYQLWWWWGGGGVGLLTHCRFDSLVHQSFGACNDLGHKTWRVWSCFYKFKFQTLT